MRIISGTFRGKKILEPKDIKTRPLKDLTKESIFNILSHSNKFKIDLENSNILDLFSGVGSFGIECLSRGAKYVVFAEKYNGVLPVLKKNLQSLKSIENYEILEKDIYNIGFLKSLDKKFDIIFLEHAFKDRNINNYLETKKVTLMALKLKLNGLIEQKEIMNKRFNNLISRDTIDIKSVYHLSLILLYVTNITSLPAIG